MKKPKQPKTRPLDLNPLWEKAKKEFFVAVQKSARSTEPADRELMESKVRRLYKALGKSEPQIFWSDSPFQLFVIPYLIDRFGRAGDASYGEVWSQAEQKYFSSLDPGVLRHLNLGAMQNRLSKHFPLPESMSYRPQDTVLDVARVLHLQARKLIKMVKLTVGTSYAWDSGRLGLVYDRITDRVWRDINTPAVIEEKRALSSRNLLLWSRTANDILDSIGDSEGLLNDNNPFLISRQRWAEFLPLFREWRMERGFAQMIHLHMLVYSLAHWTDKEEPDAPDAIPTILWSELIESLWWIACYEHTVFLCERPVIVSFDASERLHHEDGPAVSFKDGYRQYFWHGLPVPSYVIDGELTVEAVESERNIEIRRVLIERFGLQQYLFASGAEVVQADQYGALYRKQSRDDEALVTLHVVNKTPEPDGSYKEYFLRVPPTMHTAQEAVAWTFGLDADSYKPIVET